ncbi:PREDICTED: glutaredoxin-C4-like isoform X2 [Rhagoletis zephyria]|uniref:glutaredoxin-C4-like isoform X2 n=1 Tax=Rhagoletis zephyria TaxID=28612 RepID=UPI000811362D|nr:PREDICTED: glutaredoxin-C4-like isoform X2 [Rhagoletis zephyria]
MGSVISALLKKPIVNVNMSNSQADMVREVIANNKQFRKLAVPAYVVELDSRTDAEEIQNILGEITGGRTVSNRDLPGRL